MQPPAAAPKPLHERQSTRQPSSKRIRYEPAALGQGPKDASGFSATTEAPNKHLIVDTGASHVLFREQDSHVLANVQWSVSPPFAILKAANGALLNAIGRGMLTIHTVTVVGYIFRDKDLVHNLLGIAPFADRGCTAMFTSEKFKLYHRNRIPILSGTRHAQNLWRIAIPDLPPSTATAVTPRYDDNKQVLLLHHQSDPDAEHIQFVHATLGSPPPTTFLKAAVRGYINGPRLFPRLTPKLVRRHMPNSTLLPVRCDQG
jgi:hypothetical protein